MKKITLDEYKKACKETYILITEYFEDTIAKCIPENKILLYKNNMDNNYVFEYDETKEINDQILYATKCIIANLFRDYIANEEDKK